MVASGEDSPEALSGFVKFHPQYPVLKVPGGACGPPCASRSRLARGCILRASPPRVKGKFGFGRIYCGARADSAEPSGFSQLAQSLPRGPCRPSLWRSLHNLYLIAQLFRDSQDESLAFHGASFAAWAKAPTISPIRRRRTDGVAEIAREEGASEPTADPQRLVEHSSRGQSRIPELGGAHAAQRRRRHRPAAPPDAWVGLAAEPAEAGGRPPIDESLLRGPVGGPDGRVVARVALAGEGPPGIERLRQAVDVGAREPAAAESEPAPIPSTASTPPSGGCLPWANRPLRARRGRGGQAPNASPTRCGSPRCARTDPARPPRARRRRAHPDFAMPMRGGGALSVRALKWGREVRANEKGAPARADAPE